MTGIRWPLHILNIRELLRALNDGFVLTDWMDPGTDKPIPRLMKDGEFSPLGRLSAAAAATCRARYVEHDKTLDDGTIVYKRRPDRLPNKPNARENR